MTSRASRAACAVILAVLLGGGLGAVALGQTQPATPSTAVPGSGVGPTQCRVGVDVLSINTIDLNNDTFNANFWIWSVCPKGTLTPLKTIEFVNANGVTTSKYNSIAVDGVIWEYEDVSGTFRHLWDLTDFPFDHQVLQIVMEDSENEASALVYQPDAAGSALEGNASPEGWRISQFQIQASERLYHTSYGDPQNPTDTTTYPRLTVSMTLHRTDDASFLKLTFVVYIAVFLSLISSFLSLKSTNLLFSRLTINMASLFAVAVNLNTATNALSSEASLTMVDRIHIVALVAILIDALAALTTQILDDRGVPAARIVRFNEGVMVGVLAAFVAANVWLIAMAAVSG